LPPFAVADQVATALGRVAGGRAGKPVSKLVGSEAFPYQRPSAARMVT